MGDQGRRRVYAGTRLLWWPQTLFKIPAHARRLCYRRLFLDAHKMAAWSYINTYPGVECRAAQSESEKPAASASPEPHVSFCAGAARLRAAGYLRGGAACAS
eukprot:3089147-Pleurochrysis_carterae.AAC.1